MSETAPELPQKPRTQVNFRFSERGVELLKLLAKDIGVTQTGVMEMALRDLAKARGVGSEDSSGSLSGSKE